MTSSLSLNADYIDAQYKRWKDDPASVSRDWRFFFKGFNIGISHEGEPAGICDDKIGLKQAGVEALIHRYREIGHFLACMDPLSDCPIEHPLLSLSEFGLSSEDMDTEFYAPDFSDTGKAGLRNIIQDLRETYCQSVGVEFMHLQDPGERQWLQKRMESLKNRPNFSEKEKIDILKKLMQSALFEKFLSRKYIGITRFSLEGGDIIIPLLNMLIEYSVESGITEIILGMAHRGRLNVQVNVLNKPYSEIFTEFEACYDPSQLTGSGDVKYHNGYLADVILNKEKKIRICMASNPSHLEAVDPVVEGMARARQDILGIKKAVLPLLLHGDAAFSGQGIVAETLGMGGLNGYSTSGTIHVIINNQIGFTTLPDDARSTRYSTDVAKMLMIPIFHVHGEDPEAGVHMAELALDYRNTFEKDVIIDVVSYRRYGHNEGDEPYFTQPMMYERIKKRPLPYQLYAERLIENNIVDQKKIEDIQKSINQVLSKEYKEIHGTACAFPEQRFYENIKAFQKAGHEDFEPSGTEKKTLLDLQKKLTAIPDGFSVHPKIRKLFEKRLSAVETGTGIDWSNAETLAFAVLLTEGVPVRLSGQDVQRGTFSQRHSVLFDTVNGKTYTPLQYVDENQTQIEITNSPLGESGVLGFEYGYSVLRPECLNIWEAQFGDFVNNAQSIIDLFIASGETKWNQLSGLVMLLPHGWEGLGPEHSSARLERFLQLCAEDNMRVCNPTAPSQYFHLLLNQAKSKNKKPLIIMSPKSLLRHPMAVSDLDELFSGSFNPVMENVQTSKSINRVIFCSGKIYYQLTGYMAENGIKNCAIIRVEQLYPFPEKDLTGMMKKYKNVKSWIWVQEEPENMGAWQFIRSRLEDLVESRIEYTGRPPASSPATGNPNIYKKEQRLISELAFKD